MSADVKHLSNDADGIVSIGQASRSVVEAVRPRGDYDWWLASIAGEKPLTYETAECGYFKMRDRRGLNKNLAAIKRPWIACAIWRDPASGELMAERAGTACHVDTLWPYCARHPITYDDYAYWHQHERFPEVAA